MIAFEAALIFSFGWLVSWCVAALTDEGRPEQCPNCGEPLWGEAHRKAIDGEGGW